jgi:hypothetical protein
MSLLRNLDCLGWTDWSEGHGTPQGFHATRLAAKRRK